VTWKIAAGEPVQSGATSVTQFPNVRFLVATKSERLNSADVFNQLPALAWRINRSTGLRPNPPRPRAKINRPIAFLVRIGCRFGSKMPLKVGKSGVIIRTVSRIIFGLMLPPVSVRVAAVSP
jgi:hypothetical protein